MSCSAPTAANSRTMKPANRIAPPAAISPAPVVTCDTFSDSSAFASCASWCTRVWVSRHRSAKSPIRERPRAYSCSGISCCGIDAMVFLLERKRGGDVGLVERARGRGGGGLGLHAGLHEARSEEARGRCGEEERHRLAAREGLDLAHHAVQVVAAQGGRDALQAVGG